MWNTLGTFDFDGTAGTGFVELWNRTSTGYLVADGVMFERIATPPVSFEAGTVLAD
jgi:hypothetical protein